MKLFHFYRTQDASGVSGTGPVVEGVEFTNGWCALRWMTGKSSICFYQSLEEVKAIHGHGGKTEVIVHDFPPLRRRKTQEGEQRFERFLELIEAAAEITNLAGDPDTTPAEVRSAIHKMRSILSEVEENFGLSKVKKSA